MTQSFPAATRLLAALAKRLYKPGFCFSTLGLSYNNLAPRHADRFNAQGSESGLAKLSPFERGGLILSSASQPESLAFEGNTLYFDAHQPQETEPWAQGERLVLVAYTMSGLDKLPSQDARALLQAGFSLPGQAGAAMPTPVNSDQPRRQPDSGPPVPNPDHPNKPYKSRRKPELRPKVQRAQGPGQAGVLSAELGVTIEVFCGAARLSVALQELGFETIAIDHIAKSNHPVQTLDLTDPEQAKILEEIIENQAERIRLIHFAPPCGTASAKHLRLKPCFPVWEGCSLPVPVYPSTAVRGHRRVHPQRVYCVASGG